MNDKNKINNINNNDGNIKNNNIFNIEYNNEILVEENKGTMLSDIISSNSELNKNNQGLNSRIVINVPKTKIIEKNKLDLDKNDKNMTEEIKEEKDDQQSINMNIKSNEFPIQENPDIKNQFNEEKENKMNNNSSIKEPDNKNEIEIIEIDQKSESKNDMNINNKKLEGESSEGEINSKDKESKNIDKESNIKENNIIEIQIDIKKNDKNSINDEDSETLLRDKIIYSENEKSELNKIEDLSKPKEYKEEVITGIIKGIPKKEINQNEIKPNIENEIITKEQNKENNKIPITLNSILKGNIDDNIKLNKNISNNNIFELKDEKINENVNEINIGKNQINPIENNIKIEKEDELQNNFLKEQIPKMNLILNDESSINNMNKKLDKLEEKEKYTKYSNGIEVNEKNEISNENNFDIKDDKLKKEYNNINENNLKEEMIEGEIPRLNQKINTSPSPIQIDKNIKISPKENEEDALNNISNNNKEKIIELNKGKETKIYESITGSIIGTPRMKNIIEYGNTKGYKRPNIKKGKDFIHNPKIIIEGTIKGTKKIPPTLRSIFQENINQQIILNNTNLLKPSEYIISKADIPSYLKNTKDLNISDESIKIPKIKIDNPEIKIENINKYEEKEKNNEILSPRLHNSNNIIKNEIDTKIKLNNDDIKNSDINKEDYSKDIIIENPSENFEIHLPKNNSDFDINIAKNSNEYPKIEEIKEITESEQSNKINNNNNINEPLIKSNHSNLGHENKNSNEKIIEEKIPSIDENNNFNINEEEKERINIPDISYNDNKKEEIIEEKKSYEDKEKKTEIKINIPNKNFKLIEDNNNNKDIKNGELTKEKETKIYESITGSIIGTPRMKNIVEYGSTKGYKRPSIKKGKDFIHNPKIVIEGTIKGTKKIPLTLKSLFEDKINNKIELNKLNKHPEIKLEDYQESLQLNFDINNPINEPKNILKNDINLKSGYKTTINNPKLPELKDKIIIGKEKTVINKNLNGEEIKGIIPGIKKNLTIQPEENKIKGQINRPNIGGDVNNKISNINKEKIKEDIPNYNKSINTNINRPDIKDKESNESKFKSDKEKKIKIYESITGNIIGTPRMKNIVEYGNTKGYKRPNIKKGKDFIHNPKIIIEGTIKGTKKIPLTLKSLFEDKINNKIELNNSISKIKDEYKIKNDDIEVYSLNLSQPKININSPELKLANPKLNEYNLKIKEDLLKDKIRSIDINLKNNDSKSNISLKNSSKMNAQNNNNKQKEISVKINENIKVRNIDNNNMESIEMKDNINENKTEIISGFIMGTSKNKTIEKEKESLKRNEKESFIKINNDNININSEKEIIVNITGSIKGTSTLKNIVEYGSTKGYKRPNIKKGKDFIHNPEIVIKGIIGGKKTIDSNKEEKINEAKTKPKVQLRKAEKLTFIEYGSTLNFVRPNIKKGKDFYHEPKVKISKKNYEDATHLDNEKNNV